MTKPAKRKAADDVSETDATARDAAEQFLEDAQRAVDFAFSPQVVLPGDDVTETVTKTSRRVQLGTRALSISLSCRRLCPLPLRD